MSSVALAGRYAQALFDAAEERQNTADIAEQVNMLALELAENEDFRQLIIGRGVSAPRKKDLIDQVFGEALHPFVRNFLFVLLDKNRENLVPEALSAFTALYRKKLGVVTARLTTAKPIGKAEEDKLSSALHHMLNNDVVLERRVDPSIMGGAIINVGDLLIDGSLKSKLRRMREELTR